MNSLFIAAVNAVLRHTGAIQGTVHCRDKAPSECSQKLVEKIKSEFGNPKVALVGFQPRMAEALAKEFPLKITDLDEENIGEEKFGVVIQGPAEARDHSDWSDLLVVTGSTAVNGTMNDFVGKKPTLFYGVTVAGPAYLLGLNRFCPLGT